jgi:antitoxin VapB
MTRTAKLFLNGRSQAVRLPADLRFDGSEVFIRQDVASGAVILSRRPESWDQFFKLRAETAETGGTEEFMKVREDEAPQKRNLF